MNRNVTDLPFDDIKRIINSCRKLGIQALRITGGEPFLRHDIGLILSLIKSSGIYCLLNSNASLMQSRDFSIVRSCVDNLLVSLQGYSRSTDARLGGNGHLFDAKIKNILRLRKTVPVLRIGTIITRTLIKNFDRYAKLIRLIQPDDWELYRPMTVPWAAGREYDLNRENYLDLLLNIKKNDAGSCRAKIANAFPFCALPDPMEDGRFLLGSIADDGHNRLVYDVRGFYKPSYHLQKNLGNDLRKAWKSPFLKKIRSLDYLPPACHACTFLSWCRGGSRFGAFCAYGDYFKRDPLMR